MCKIFNDVSGWALQRDAGLNKKKKPKTNIVRGTCIPRLLFLTSKYILFEVLKVNLCLKLGGSKMSLIDLLFEQNCKNVYI